MARENGGRNWWKIAAFAFGAVAAAQTYRQYVAVHAAKNATFRAFTEHMSWGTACQTARFCEERSAGAFVVPIEVCPKPSPWVPPEE